MKEGDIAIIYIKWDSITYPYITPAIAGIFSVISSPYYDTAPLFNTPKNMGNEKFPCRIKLEPIKIFNIPLEFKPLVEKLPFIRNKQKWGGHLQGCALRDIGQKDYEIIFQAGKDNIQ